MLFDDDAFMLPNEKLRESGTTDPRAKSDAIRQMIDEIMRTVRAWRPEAEFGRNIYALAAEHDGLYPMFAQDLDEYLRDYDLTVVMAYAHMEQHGDDSGPWVHRLVGKVLGRWRAGGRAPVLFKLQAPTELSPGDRGLSHPRRRQNGPVLFLPRLHGRQRDDERRPLPRLALHANLPAMVLDDSVSDGEP